MLEQVKIALRISHNVLDEDINATIEVARADAIRSGVPVEIMTNDNDPLAFSVIKTYCLFNYVDDEKAKERYWFSYQYQVDCLRKSKTYVEGATNVQ